MASNSEYNDETDSFSETLSDTGSSHSSEHALEEDIKKYLPIFLINQDISAGISSSKKRKHSEIDDNTHKLLNEIKSVTLDDKSNLLHRIIHSNFSNNVKKTLVSMYEENSIDKKKYHNYIERVLKIPSGKYSKINSLSETIPNFMTLLRKNLDDSIAGHNETKEEVIDYISSILRNPEANSNILALQSPPGCGKTKFVRALGKALNLPFQQISFGGLNDPSLLTGHDFTYVGSKPGKIYDILVKSKCMNSIIMLDEIDKIGDIDSPKTKEVNGILTHILDKEQNTEFHDNYLGLDIPLDLSKILFIATFNHEHNIDPIILNRMKVIKIKESTLSEKIEIVKKFTIPEIIKNYHLEKFHIEIPDKIIKYIIINKTVHEPGMRNINKNIRTLIGKINTLLYLECTTETQRNYITKDLSYSNIKLNRTPDYKIVVDIDLVDKFISQRSTSQFINMMYN